MSIRIMLVLHLLLLLLVAANVVYVFDWPGWADSVVFGGMAGAVLVILAAVRSANRQRRGALLVMQVLGTLGLAAAAAALAAPAWQVLGGGASAAAAGRMAPMFLTALALYAANLWLDAALLAERREALERLARLLAGPRLLPALVTALLLTAGLILGMDWLGRGVEDMRVVTVRFLERGIIPPITVLLFFWGALLLLGKQWNVWHLRRALGMWRGDVGGGAGVAGVVGGGVVSDPFASTADAAAGNPAAVAGAANAISAAAANAAAAANPNAAIPTAANPTAPTPAIPTAAGAAIPLPASAAAAHPNPLVAGIQALVAAASQQEGIAMLWQRYDESYLFPRYISWAVPVLGFIGTVLGISLAADGIRRIIGSDSGLSGLSGDLSGAIAPLGIAFDTTLIALSLSVCLTLLLSLVQRAEERVLSTLEWQVRGTRHGD